MNTHRLRALIAERYNQGQHGTPREWAVFFELRNSTGAGGPVTNYVDAFAMNLWPSKRFWRVAFEFKVSRSDFLKELSKPEKRQWAMDISHEFYFVCSPGIAKKEEIPEGCGLMEANADGTKLKRVVVAKQRKPRELRMEEIASIARRSTESDSMASLTWKLAGKELNAEELKQLLDDRLDAHCDARIEEQVRERVAKAVLKIQNKLDLYVSQMERVGITPPNWMKDFDPSGPTDAYHFDRWVERNVFPGPNVSEVSQALQKQKRNVDLLESVLEQSRQTAANLEALMNRQLPVEPKQTEEGQSAFSDELENL